MLEIGSYAVCPGHGVGQISEIVEKTLGEEKKFFYVVKVLSNSMTVMVPTDSEHGIRVLVEGDEIQEMYNLLADHDVTVDTSTWNRRYRDYMSKVKTGSLLEIAKVLRDLFLLKSKKNLSFGEKKMLDQCKDLISEEIALSQGSIKKDIDSKIIACFES